MSLVFLLLISMLMPFMRCEQDGKINDDFIGVNTTDLSDPGVLNHITELVYKRLSSVTSPLIHSKIAQGASYCIADPEEDWKRSFDYSANLDFLSKCLLTTRGDLPERLCTAAELNFYFTNLIAYTGSSATFPKANRNCNFTSWVSGCEPGWACTAGLTRPVNLRDSHEIPARTSDCRPCCEGFFCPEGLTCMITCPLGSYCPLATFNVNTGLCQPYLYQLPRGKPNHTCGGANIWADVSTSGSMFCSAGSYCPTNTEKIPCDSRHYCRMGSTEETRCHKLSVCGSNTPRQNILKYGVMSMRIVVISVVLFILYKCCWLAVTSFENRYVTLQELPVKSVVSVPIDIETRRRAMVQIEIAFTDLTVTLKQNKKHLLRSVTGKIQPGRITAIMGPSGAGKTTLLLALAGRTVGRSITGTIKINEEVESIRSYKKIVGFVPQDDIVHGNLTVEENIWFSANCRLPADLRMADKALIVNRVIESLGLQDIRNSLVGTVEEPVISGGQRKRVNIGLELVMEPSLLFLDEPTSGLDSSSSQLLLRALKREAREGVNICMVVHQPSYSLFDMFDDLILLAKGGLTAYHGPVRDVEDYFAHLGIHVPERINPPDYFIDVLEGMVEPSTSSGVTYEELPLRWMLHKGYPVPEDMQPDVSGAGTVCIMHSYLGNQGAEQLSFWAEFWQNLKYKVEARCDVVCNNFLKSKDLSGRRTPCIPIQYKHFLGRIAKQRLREAKIQAIDYLILMLAGACMGWISKSSDESFGAPGYIYTIIATSLLCKTAALRTFALDKLQYRRERASAISSLAYFVAKDTIDHFNTLMKPLVYLSMFHFISNPRSSFFENYTVLFILVYCVTGIAYVFAIFLEPGPSQLCSVLLPVVLTLLSTQPKNSKFMKVVTSLCYPSWALEAFIVSNAKRYYGVWLIQRCGVLRRTGYNIHHWGLAIFLLVVMGFACRALAFISMLFLQK